MHVTQCALHVLHVPSDATANTSFGNGEICEPWISETLYTGGHYRLEATGKLLSVQYTGNIL